MPLPQDPSHIDTSPMWAGTFLNLTGNVQQFVNAAATQPNNSYYRRARRLATAY